MAEQNKTDLMKMMSNNVVPKRRRSENACIYCAFRDAEVLCNRIPCVDNCDGHIVSVYWAAVEYDVNGKPVFDAEFVNSVVNESVKSVYKASRAILMNQFVQKRGR